MGPESQDGTATVQKRTFEDTTGVGVMTGRRERDWQGQTEADLRKRICSYPGR